MPIEAGPGSKKTIDADGNITVGALRKRMWKSFTPAIAHDVGLPLEAADRFLHMAYTPSRDVLHVLAKRLGML